MKIDIEAKIKEIQDIADNATLKAAGYLDKDMNLTKKGKEMLLIMMFVDNKSRLVSIARELSEEK